jgi:Aspartyl protease
MPSISGNYNPAVGVIIQVAIVDAAQAAALGAGQQSGQNPSKLTLFAALLDTGASVTCISSNVVQSLGLQPSGKTTMSGSTGASTVDQYTFGVVLVFGAQQTPSGAFSGQLNLHLVQGCEFTHHGFGFDVLIGRDILCKGSFSMSFDGHFILSL